jgi:hypothetical protein
MDNNRLPWDDDRPSVKSADVLEDTLAASRRLDHFLLAAIESGLLKDKETTTMSNKLMEFVDIVESGLKELEAEVDAEMPGFQNAMVEGRENMQLMRGHVKRAKEAIAKVKDFNNKMAGSNINKS